MDLHDFAGEAMYFDRPLPPAAATLIGDAAAAYGSDADTDTAELALLRAYLQAPDHLSVLVALYRFYYYRQRYEDALLVADRAIVAAAEELGLGTDWRALGPAELGAAAVRSMTLTRFLLLAQKGAGFLLLRLGRPAAALERLEQAAACDDHDRLGLRDLLAWARTASAREQAAGLGGKVRFIRP
ncbi:MAG: hypothetical protein EA400_01805 [Chromatiaceae bacterium]|nr:MAG: hypothetical protein EA400_01805 [Chromatiaceae bacterium]